MFKVGETARCVDAHGDPQLYVGACYRVLEVDHGHLRLEGVDKLREPERFLHVWPHSLGEVMESVPLTLPDGREVTASVLRTSSRPGGRRVIVSQGGALLFDTDACYDLGSALNGLDRWLQHLGTAKGIPF